MPDPSERSEDRGRLSYPELHKLGLTGWWRSLLGVAGIGVIGFVVLPLLLGGVFMLGMALFGMSTRAISDEFANVADQVALSPTMLAYTLLSLWCVIPVAWLVQRVCHGLPPGTLWSVLARLRLRYLAVCTGMAVLAVALTVGVAQLLPSTTEAGADVTHGLNAITATTWQYLVVVVLLVPLQATAEELVFRGYLMQAWGGLFGGRRAAQTAAVLGSALVFAAMHGTQELPIFLDRFSFGVVAGVLVIVTGGLEAAIALHVVNNLYAFITPVLFGDINGALWPEGSTWWQLPVSLTQVVSFGLLAWWVARRTALARTISRSGRLRPVTGGDFGPAGGPV